MEIGCNNQNLSSPDIKTVTRVQNTEIVKSDVKVSERNTETINKSEKEKSTYREQDVKKAVDKLNKVLEDSGTHVEYEKHKVLGDIMIRIVNDETKEVIRELPPKKILDMVAKMCELAGLVVDGKA